MSVDLLNLALVVLNVALSIAFIAQILRFQRSLPELIQCVLNDIGEQLSKIFEKPTVSRAMGIIAKKGGEVRADKALKERVASKVVDNHPILKRALDYFEIEPLEGLSLLNDPDVGPLIQGFLAQGMKGIEEIGNRFMSRGNNGGSSGEF